MNHRTLFQIAALALLYYVAARIGVRFALGSEYATPVWIPSGIAIFAIILEGNKVSPGVWLGSFTYNILLYFQRGRPNGLALSAGLTIALTIACASTLQAIVGARVLKPIPVQRVHGALTFLGLSATVCLIAATIGISTIFLFGAGQGSFAANWFTWWLGDTLGILAVALPLSVWQQKYVMSQSRLDITKRHLVELEKLMIEQKRILDGKE